MAQKVQIVLEDDIDGGEASETVSFGLDGVQYEIDVNEEHASQLRQAIWSFAEHARRVKGQRKQPRTTVASLIADANKTKNGTTNNKHSSREIRDWARTEGLDVPATGRIPKAIVEQFEAVH